MSLKYKLLSFDTNEFLTVYIPGRSALVASRESHEGSFDEMVRLAKSGDESVIDLFDVASAVEKKFNDVPDITVGRVSVRNSQVFYDDDPLDNSIAQTILRFHEEGKEFTPLVAFIDNVMANPQEESREQFYRWLQHNQFPVNEEGFIVGYKSVKSLGDGSYSSLSHGHAFVNGVESNGPVIQRIGDIVTMPRSEVDFNPNSSCSSGLHAGTWEYASNFDGDTVMHVLINPRDVVSVPHNSSSQKVRLCRYKVLSFAPNKFAGVVYPGHDKVDSVDTRLNHLKQRRGPNGRFIK